MREGARSATQQEQQQINDKSVRRLTSDIGAEDGVLTFRDLRGQTHQQLLHPHLSQDILRFHRKQPVCQTNR